MSRLSSPVLHPISHPVPPSVPLSLYPLSTSVLTRILLLVDVQTLPWLLSSLLPDGEEHNDWDNDKDDSCHHADDDPNVGFREPDRTASFLRISQLHLSWKVNNIELKRGYSEWKVPVFQVLNSLPLLPNLIPYTQSHTLLSYLILSPHPFHIHFLSRPIFHLYIIFSFTFSLSYLHTSFHPLTLQNYTSFPLFPYLSFCE